MTSARNEPTDLRLGVLSTHLIQYFTPLYRELSHSVDAVEVLYLRAASAERGTPMHDEGFGIDVEWDTDLTSGYDWHSLGLTSAPFRYSIRDYRSIYSGVSEWARRFRPEVVLVPGWTLPYLISVVALHRAGVALICRPEGRQPATKGIRRRARDTIVRRFVSSMSAAAVVGSDARAELTRLGMPDGHCHESPYVVDDVWWTSRAVAALKDRSATRGQWGVGSDVTVYVSVGKLLPYKNPLLLLDVFSTVHQRVPETHLVMVGTGELMDDVRARIISLGLDACVTLLGFVNQSALPQVLVASDVFVMVSNETWGLAANEALACGLPLAVSDEAGCSRDLVADEVTGFRLPVSHPDVVADKLVALSDSTFRANMEVALRNLAERHTVARAASGIIAAALDAARLTETGTSANDTRTRTTK